MIYIQDQLNHLKINYPEQLLLHMNDLSKLTDLAQK